MQQNAIKISLQPVLDGEILSPDRICRPGMTIAEIIDEAFPGGDASLRRQLRVSIVLNDASALIEPHLWARVKPHRGTTVVIQVTPGDEKLRAVLTVVVAVAAIALGAWLGPLAFGATGALSASGWTGLIGLGVVTLGTLAINALIPPPEEPRAPKLNWQISGWQNPYIPDGVVPMIFGKHRYAPPFAIRPYVTIIKNKQYITAVFCFGYGKLELTRHQIGETPLSDFDGVQLRTRDGEAGDTAIDMVPNQVITDPDSNVELLCPRPRNSRGEIQNEPGTPMPIRRTLARDSKRAKIILFFPAGLVRIENDGDEREIPVHVRVRAREVGTGPWTYNKDIKVQRATRDPFYVEHEWALSPRGNYEIDVARTTDEAFDNQRIDRVSLIAIQSIRPEYWNNFPDKLCLVAIRIKASEQLNGALDSYNAVASRVCLDWNGSTWVEGETRNPASMFRKALQGAANAKPFTNAEIDLDSIADWHEFCDDKGLRYDRVHDYEASLFDTLKMIAAAGRASPRWNGRQWSVVIDRPQSLVVDHINPRNSRGMRGSRTFVAPPHAFRIPFLDRTNDYQAAERIVPWPGHSGDITLVEQIDLPGKTDPDEIWIEARRLMHNIRYRPDSVQVIMDGYARPLERGDRVELSWDVLERTQKAARVVRVLGSLVELDDHVEMEEGMNYGIRFRTGMTEGDPIGSSVVRQVLTVEGETNAVVLLDVTDIPGDGEIVHFGRLAIESEAMIVAAQEPAEGMAQAISLIAVSDLIDDDTDAEEPPEWSPRIGAEIEIPDEPGGPEILRVLSGMSGTGTSGGLVVLVGPDPDSEVPPAEYEIQHRLAGDTLWTTETVEAASATADIDDYLYGDSVEIRARALSRDGTPGPYSDIVDAVIGEEDGGVPAALPDESIEFTGLLGYVRIEGVAGADTNTARLQIYRNASIDPDDIDRDADALGEAFVIAPERTWAFTDGDPSRVNKVGNPAFGSSKGWTVGTDWSISDGVATHVPGSASSLTRDVTMTNNKWYRIGFLVGEIAAGDVTPRLGGTTPVVGSTVTIAGIALDRLQANSDSDKIAFGASAGFDGWIDDVVLYYETAASLPQGEHVYWIEPLNGEGIAGPLSGPFIVTVI